MIGQTKATNLVVERAASRGQSAVTQMPVEVRTQVWYNPDLRSAYYMIPALIGLILMFMSTLLTSTSIVRERERGTIEQLIVTPLRSIELVVGKLTPYVLIAVIDMAEIIGAGVLMFGVPINGSLPLLLVLSGLFLVSTLGLGLFVSTLANTQQEAMLTSMFFLLPAMFLSGFLFPLAGMPWYLQALSYVVPLRYFLVITRGIMLKGAPIDVLWTEVVALGIFAVVIMGGAALRFRKRLD
jgi:ABC-2 type transport system permease protein